MRSEVFLSAVIILNHMIFSSICTTLNRISIKYEMRWDLHATEVGTCKIGYHIPMIFWPEKQR